MEEVAAEGYIFMGFRCIECGKKEELQVKEEVSTTELFKLMLKYKCNICELKICEEK